MGLFHRKQAEPSLPAYSLADFEPVIRSSICTGEQVACMRHRTSGQLREIMLIRSQEDLEEFCRQYRVDRESVRTIY